MENSWRLSTIIIVVKDMDKAVRHYESIGLGPFSPESMLDRTKLYTKLEEVSRPDDKRAKLIYRTAQLGQLHLELIQPVEGQSLQKEFLDSKGEGVVNLSFNVDDLAAEKAKLVKQGVPVMLSAETDRYSITIFDISKTGDLYVQLLQWVKQGS